jgi:hypothetical protein
MEKWGRRGSLPQMAAREKTGTLLANSGKNPVIL